MDLDWRSVILQTTRFCNRSVLHQFDIMTLVLISFERLKAVVEPFSARFTASVVLLRKLVALWAGSFIIASPLLYAYQAQMDDSAI